MSARDAYDSPGWRRMAARRDPAALEAMRQDVLREQRAARDAAGGARPDAPADRAGSRGYPAPRPKKRPPR